MPAIIEFPYHIGQEVKIKAIAMKGQIASLSQDICGQQFCVVYWNNGQRYSTWMHAWEVESA